MSFELPYNPTEFELQAYSYAVLRSNGFDARGETKVKGSDGNRGARFDIAIYDRGKLSLILEVKRSEKSKAKGQGQRYFALTGVPVLYLRGKADALRVLELVRSALAA